MFDDIGHDSNNRAVTASYPGSSQGRKDRGAQGFLGRSQGAKSLAETEFKMADHTYANIQNVYEINEALHEIERPIHKNASVGKIVCFKRECIDQKAFFEETGIEHNFRVKHKEKLTMSDRKECTRMTRELHAQETMECFEKIFEYRRNKVKFR